MFVMLYFSCRPGRQVPVHRSTNWDKFYVEMLMIAGIVVYFINFVSGKTRNQKLANAWLNAHKNLLESNFSLVGTFEAAQHRVYMQASIEAIIHYLQIFLS